MIENAKIESTFLGVEDHGIFTCHLFLGGEGWSQAFGGYTLDEYEPEKRCRIGTAYGMRFIAAILNTLEIESWEKLSGVVCRIDRGELVGDRIHRLGHVIKDKWFDPKELLEEEGRATNK